MLAIATGQWETWLVPHRPFFSRMQAYRFPTLFALMAQGLECTDAVSSQLYFKRQCQAESVSRLQSVPNFVTRGQPVPDFVVGGQQVVSAN